MNPDYFPNGLPPVPMNETDEERRHRLKLPPKQPEFMAGVPKGVLFLAAFYIGRNYNRQPRQPRIRRQRRPFFSQEVTARDLLIYAVILVPVFVLFALF